MNTSSTLPFDIQCDQETGRIRSVRLFENELLNSDPGITSEIAINGIPLSLTPYPDPSAQEANATPVRFKADRFVDFWAGAGLVVNRSMGARGNTRFGCYGLEYWIRRDHIDVITIPYHGPGGPGVEAPLWIDTITAPSWNWKFWGESTRMIYFSTHSNAADHEWTHIGYNHDTPETVKAFMQNPFRRQYPGTMLIHGGLFYDAQSGNWLAITCRRPHLGYQLNIESAGRGVSYDFTLHAFFPPGENLRLPEVRFYYGKDREEMMRWLAEYATHYYEEPPAWLYKTHFLDGLAWNNKPTWTEQADYWEQQLNEGLGSGISYSLVTNRPLKSGTSPIGYEPDPAHGTREEFKRMCHRLADRDIPLVIWMSHSGLVPGATDIDEDWFVRGIDGQKVASWGSRDGGLCFVNPGHPGYIAYTKRWMDFYLRECRCRGIYFDCYGFSIPPDFTPRPFMRYPGQTALMTVRFMEEVFKFAKECNPEALIWGEGASIEGPVHGFSMNANPCRSIDGMGPREFLLHLNQYSPKRISLDQGPSMNPACGYSKGEPDQNAWNKYMTAFLKEKGRRDTFKPLLGDMSLCDDILVVPPGGNNPVGLPKELHGVERLVEVTNGTVLVAENLKAAAIPPGIYRLESSLSRNSSGSSKTRDVL